MTNPKTTFVTAFIDLEEDRSKTRSPETCVEHFRHLVLTGIPIHLYVSPSYYSLVEPVISTAANVYVEKISLQELELYKDLSGQSYEIPGQRADYKDTVHFMILMNAKTELVHTASCTNHFGTPQFAWIDFSIFHVIKDRETTQEWLRTLSLLELKDPGLYIPGCWQKGALENRLFSQINWRFCGGFFLGDSESVTEFQKLYKEHFVNVTTSPVGGLTWEVNFWHYLEMEHRWNPVWFQGDHNDTILQVPIRFFGAVCSSPQ